MAVDVHPHLHGVAQVTADEIVTYIANRVMYSYLSREPLDRQHLRAVVMRHFHWADAVFPLLFLLIGIVFGLALGCAFGHTASHWPLEGR